MTLHFSIVNSNVDLESLEKVHNHENSNSGCNVVEIGEIFSQETVFEGLEKASI